MAASQDRQAADFQALLHEELLAQKQNLEQQQREQQVQLDKEKAVVGALAKRLLMLNYLQKVLSQAAVSADLLSKYVVHAQVQPQLSRQPAI